MLSTAGRSGSASPDAWPSRRFPPGRRANGGARGRLVAPARLRRLRAALGRFLLGVRGAAAIETALSVGVLVIAFAGIMQAVTTVFVDDQTGRAARAAARMLALDPDADPWRPVWHELHPGTTHSCTTDWTATDLGTCGGWKLAVVRDVSPAALAAALDPGTTVPAGAGDAGDLVLVGLSAPPAPVPGVRTASASSNGNGNAGSNGSASANAPRTAADLVRMDAIGVARGEPDV